MKKMLPLILWYIVACKNPDAVKKYAREEAYAQSKAREEDSLRRTFSDKMLDANLLIGHWSLDIAELKKELYKNSETKQQAEALIKDFERQYSSIEMEFYADKRFEIVFNDESMRGLWGISSDGASYYIQMSDDFIELHEVISLTDDTLTEVPVAEMRKARMPVKQMVYRKV